MQGTLRLVDDNDADVCFRIELPVCTGNETI